MDAMLMYGVTAVMLVVSFSKDRTRTKMSLKKAFVAFEGILPDFLAVLGLVGLVLTLMPPQLIGRFLGQSSGWLGMAFAAAFGSVTLIPGFVAFPLAKSLLGAGAGLTQIAVFVTTLTGVGIVTAPLEAKYFGRKETILRNSLAFVWAFIVAWIVGVVAK